MIASAATAPNRPTDSMLDEPLQHFADAPFFAETLTLLRSVRDHDFETLAALRDDDFGERLGVHLSPDTSHVFLCGNPAMIGLPEEENGELVYPQPEGVVALLAKRGFTLDRRNAPGNIHYEEYW